MVILLPALADFKDTILVTNELAQYSYVIPLGNYVLGLVSRIPLGTAQGLPPKEQAKHSGYWILSRDNYTSQKAAHRYIKP